MAHALADFLRTRAGERGMRNRDIEQASGLSRQLVSKYMADQRETLTRLPDRATLQGLARALVVSEQYLLAKAVESLGLGYEAGDYINTIGRASNDELLNEVARRLRSVSARVSDDAEAASPERVRPGSGLVVYGLGSGKTEGALRRFLELSNGMKVLVWLQRAADDERQLDTVLLEAGLSAEEVPPFPPDRADVSGTVDDLRSFLCPLDLAARTPPGVAAGKAEARRSAERGTESQVRPGEDDGGSA